MSHLSDRGQVEPLAALAAVFAVGAGLTLYVGALDGHFAADRDRDVAPTVADRMLAESTSGGVVTPPIADAADEARPTGHATNVTVATGGKRWAVGPSPPPDAERAERQVSVRIDTGIVRPGRLEVAVWTEP
ncbi:MAG: hypothetical protein PPP58_08980 [Natronomonas sp.]